MLSAKASELLRNKTIYEHILNAEIITEERADYSKNFFIAWGQLYTEHYGNRSMYKSHYIVEIVSKGSFGNIKTTRIDCGMDKSTANKIFYHYKEKMNK